MLLIQVESVLMGFALLAMLIVRSQLPDTLKHTFSLEFSDFSWLFRRCFFFLISCLYIPLCIYFLCKEKDIYTLSLLNLIIQGKLNCLLLHTVPLAVWGCLSSNRRDRPPQHRLGKHLPAAFQTPERLPAATSPPLLHLQWI